MTSRDALISLGRAGLADVLDSSSSDEDEDEASLSAPPKGNAADSLQHPDVHVHILQ
jgi:hypothetical protein